MHDRLILSYHGVSERWPAAVSPDRLRAQLAHLVAHAYRGITFGELLQTRAPKLLCVTFDDGYRSVIERAFPVLQELGIPATIFVPTQFVGVAPASWPGTDVWLGTEYEDELAVMPWEDLGRLARAGWEIGSHTCSHPRLTELDDAALDYELRASREAIEAELRCTCSSLAYPFGDWDERVARAAAEAGYRAACTLPAALHVASPLAWPRIGIYRHDGPGAFRMKVSPAVRRLRATRIWPIMQPERWRRAGRSAEH
jgi:peptidoglycan/xylan/chitin deacetylase (PgdA/CDA1 family)